MEGTKDITVRKIAKSSCLSLAMKTGLGLSGKGVKGYCVFISLLHPLSLSSRMLLSRKYVPLKTVTHKGTNNRSYTAVYTVKLFCLFIYSFNCVYNVQYIYN